MPDLVECQEGLELHCLHLHRLYDDVSALRQHIETAMESASAEEKVHREAQVEWRKQARTDIKRLHEGERLSRIVF